MNAKLFAEKAIREGMEYSDQNTNIHRQHFQTEDVDRLASTLSASLVVLMEERLKEIVACAYHTGQDDSEHTLEEPPDDYASRIMREVKEGNDGKDI